MANSNKTKYFLRNQGHQDRTTKKQKDWNVASRASRVKMQAAHRIANLAAKEEAAIKNCGYPDCDCNGTGWSDTYLFCSGEMAALHYAMTNNLEDEFNEACIRGEGAKYYTGTLLKKSNAINVDATNVDATSVDATSVDATNVDADDIVFTTSNNWPSEDKPSEDSTSTIVDNTFCFDLGSPVMLI